MLPVFALVGRPNVGKSTLFNRLTRSRDAIVDDQPGVTRDRLYGKGELNERRFIVVDSGGLTFEEADFDPEIQAQVEQLIDEADEVLFLVEAEGLHPHDQEVSRLLRKHSAKVTLMVNKAEGLPSETVAAEFHTLGWGAPVPVSAKRGDGVIKYLSGALAAYPEDDAPVVDRETPRIALVGRPNAGKSTLTNTLLGQQRVIVSDVPGTTRDSIQVELMHKGRQLVIIDTAGVRRRARVQDVLEKFSVVKTLQAVERANVAVLLIDAEDGITAQDANIAGMILEMGRAMVLVLNKWDTLADAGRRAILSELELKLPFLSDVPVLTISALKGSRVSGVLDAAQRAFDSMLADLPTSALNRVIEKAVEHTPPPSKRGRRIRIKFAHQAGKNPPVVVLHGNQVERLPASYLRYLRGVLIEAFSLSGVPVRLITRESENPFDEPGKKRKRSKSIVNPKRRIARQKAEKKLKERRKSARKPTRQSRDSR